MSSRVRKWVSAIGAAMLIVGVSHLGDGASAAPSPDNPSHPFDVILAGHDQILARVSEPIDLCNGGTTSGRFVVNGTEVCDRRTGLYWQRTPDTIERSYEEAMTYCPSVGPYYRLPEVKELISLVDYSVDYRQSYLALPQGHPFTVRSVGYWSATSYASNPGLAWFVHIGIGFLQAYGKFNHVGVWCVRGE